MGERRSKIPLGNAVETRLTRYGNSLGVRLPAKMAKKIGLKDGDAVIVSEDGDRLLIVPSRERKESLSDLVSGITESNQHPPVDWGLPVGKETW